ncbi:hypothetical protein U5B43_10355, partial [Campylobacter sp. 9BO]|uniref:hypothetical protein n=1 Tax=Campylobacter sp. 9BO TaxID=3424759 RepID=UPI003D33C72C
ASVDARLFSEEGRKQIKQEFKDMDKNMATIAQTLPDENSDNKIEAVFGYALNTIGGLSLGIIPTNANHGGLLGNIPGYFGYEDSKFAVLGDINAKNVYGNGILNTAEDAIKGAQNIIGDSAKQIWYNPTRGFLADGIEFLVDKLGGKSGIAKQIEKKQNEKDEFGDPLKRNIFMHSQFHEIAKHGANDAHTYFSYGAPMRESTVKKIFDIDTGNEIQFQQNEGDYVSHPENILNPKTWFMPGHWTDDYGVAREKKNKGN